MTTKLGSILMCSVLVLLAACSSKTPPQAVKMIPLKTFELIDDEPEVIGPPQTGEASYYGKQFHGRKTANGERFNMYAMTAAHRYLPLGTIIRVENLSNNKTLTVKINDRGPYIKGRILDLSYGAAKELGFVARGTTDVRITPVKIAPKRPIDELNADDEKLFEEKMLSVYSIVAGAFSHPKQAERLEGRLSKEFDDVRIVASKTAGKPVWQVLIGRYSSQDDVTKNLQRLKEIGLKRARSRS